MSVFVTGAVHARVPATSANLGPGFDALGLALSWHDDVTASVRADGLSIVVDGEGADLPRDESHLVVRAMRATFERLGGQPPGLELHCVNRIPHGRGLGSSAAAIVAGVLCARALAADGVQRLDDGATLELAGELEGHPDNIAACLLGGVTVAWTQPAARAVRLACDDSIVPVVLVPPFESSTEQARRLLPEHVPHRDAAFAAGRAALLVAALTTHPHAVFEATEDRLHQRYRAPAMPDSARLVEQLRGAGLAAVISGAGPTVLVLARGQVEAETAAGAVPPGWTARMLAVDAFGAVVTG
jgi:homoserine kinase